MEPTSENLPTAQQVKAHLKRYPPRMPSRWLTTVPLAALLAVVVLTLISSSLLSTMLLWLALIGVLATGHLRVRANQSIEHRTQQLQEMTLLRQYRGALRMAWRHIPQAATAPVMHGQTVACLALNLDELGAYDAAIVAYDYLLDRLPPDGPVPVEFQIHRALAQLANDQLTLADDTLRRLRNTIDTVARTPLAAAYHYANLVQQVYTNRFDEVVETAPQLLDRLRPLGVDAGYGYALMALALRENSAQPDAAEHNHDEALQWWHRATLLLPVEALTARFSRLQALADAGEHESATPPAETDQ